MLVFTIPQAAVLLIIFSGASFAFLRTSQAVLTAGGMEPVLSYLAWLAILATGGLVFMFTSLRIYQPLLAVASLYLFLPTLLHSQMDWIENYFLINVGIPPEDLAPEGLSWIFGTLMFMGVIFFFWSRWADIYQEQFYRGASYENIWRLIKYHLLACLLVLTGASLILAFFYFLMPPLISFWYSLALFSYLPFHVKFFIGILILVIMLYNYSKKGQ